MYKFIKTLDSDNEFDKTDVELTIPTNDVNLDDLSEAFASFIKACNFNIDNKISAFITEEQFFSIENDDCNCSVDEDDCNCSVDEDDCNCSVDEDDCNCSVDEDSDEVVTIDIDESHLFQLMKIAHDEDITLNQLINNIITIQLDDLEELGVQY